MKGPVDSHGRAVTPAEFGKMGASVGGGRNLGSSIKQRQFQLVPSVLAYQNPQTLLVYAVGRFTAKTHNIETV